MSEKKINEKELFESGEGMELEIEGDELMNGEMEEVVAEKVKQEEKENQKNKSKRGPKAGSKKNDDNKEKVPKKKKEPNYNDPMFIEKEIKKGRISAPQYRIEKTEDGTYDLLEAKGIIFAKDAKFKKYDNIGKMVEGKTEVTLKAAELYGDKFKAKHEDGTDIEHEYVRVELHKPGRDKDVVELYKVSSKKSEALKKIEAEKKKEAEKKAKAEKEAAEKEKVEKEEKGA